MICSISRRPLNLVHFSRLADPNKRTGAFSKWDPKKSMVLFQKWSPIFMEKYVILKTMVLFHIMSIYIYIHILTWSLWIKDDDLWKMISNFGICRYQSPGKKKERPKSVDSVCHTSMFGMVMDGTIQRKNTKRASLRMNHGISPNIQIYVQSSNIKCKINMERNINTV